MLNCKVIALANQKGKAFLLMTKMVRYPKPMKNFQRRRQILAKKPESKIELTAYDELFETDKSREEASLDKVQILPIAEIDDFPDHPFKVRIDEEMNNMVESVKGYGVLLPALVRPRDNGRYEMVAGHRRKMASSLAELDGIPCIIRNLSDDEATIIMVDSNIQREKILPSEKAFVSLLTLTLRHSV